MITLSVSLSNCENDDDSCPNGQREFELPDGTTTCVQDITQPQNPFPVFP